MNGYLCRFVLLIGALGSLGAQNPEYDIWISGGRIVDGAGNPWYLGDVGIKGDTIVYVGPAKKVTARQTLAKRSHLGSSIPTATAAAASLKSRARRTRFARV